MNFLAHLWLARRSDTSLAGAVLGDVVRGPDLSAYPPPIAHGIRLHRRIDAATDRHPQVVAARSRYADGMRRYAGIVIDLACDHLLARDWSRHCSEPLDVFCRQSAEDVAGHAHWFAHAGARAPTADGFARLLQSYAEADGIERAIARVAERMRRPEQLLLTAAGWQQTAEQLRPILPALLDDLDAVAGGTRQA